MGNSIIEPSMAFFYSKAVDLAVHGFFIGLIIF